MKWLGIAIGILLVFAVVSDMTWFPAWITAYRHNTFAINEEMWYQRAKLSTITGMRQVDTILLVHPYRGPSVELTAPKDSAYIDALMRSLKHMKVVRGELDDKTATDEIVVDGGADLRVRFDPARAPVVSSFLRSDDLGKIVYATLRAKGVDPRKAWRRGGHGKPVPMFTNDALNEASMEYMRSTVSTIGRMKKVDAVGLNLDVYKHGSLCRHHSSIDLRLPKDIAYINALMRSLKNLKAVRGGWDDETMTDEIDLCGVENVSLQGRFDPARAPVVSSFLRSDDLGKIVYAIFRAKGVEPRKMRPSGGHGRPVPVP